MSRPSARWGWAAALAAVALGGGPARTAPAAPAPPLSLERTIPLQAPSGRIDHLAFDAAKGRLFVAELGDGAVEAIDVASGRSLGRIAGLKEPQGVAYLPARDEVVVATGGDGQVRFYRAADLAQTGALKLGDDADNVRVDPRSGRIVVGYGGGALAVIDPVSRAVVGRVALPAHPEGFQLAGDRAFVNAPNAGRIVVADLAKGAQAAVWPNPAAQLNFPMAIEPETGRIAVVYRLPARLVLFDPRSGAAVERAETCGDADDVAFDPRRPRLYVICGGGAVDVFAREPAGVRRIARVETRGGARTGLFAPELDRLIVAARAQARAPAALLVFRPAP